MECTQCGEEAEYDRLTVDRETGTVQGSLCVHCEAAVLNGRADASMVSCLDCGGTPDVLFPRWDSITEYDDDSRPVDAEYRIDLRTAAACRECLDESRTDAQADRR